MVQENSIWAWQMVCLHQGSTITVLSSTALDTHTHHNTEPPTRSVTPQGFTMAGNHPSPASNSKPTTAQSRSKATPKSAKQCKQGVILLKWATDLDCIGYGAVFRGWQHRAAVLGVRQQKGATECVAEFRTAEKACAPCLFDFAITIKATEERARTATKDLGESH